MDEANEYDAMALPAAAPVEMMEIVAADPRLGAGEDDDLLGGEPPAAPPPARIGILGGSPGDDRYECWYCGHLAEVFRGDDPRRLAGDGVAALGHLRRSGANLTTAQYAQAVFAVWKAHVEGRCAAAGVAAEMTAARFELCILRHTLAYHKSQVRADVERTMFALFEQASREVVGEDGLLAPAAVKMVVSISATLGTKRPRDEDPVLLRQR